MKTDLLKTSSIIALTAFLGFQLPATDLGRLIEGGLGIAPAAAQTVLPVEADGDHTDAEDDDDDEDDDDEDDDDEDDDDEDDDDQV